MLKILFIEVLLERPNEHVLHCLVLVYLTSRSYYDTSASDSLIGLWSHEEEHEEQRKSPCMYIFIKALDIIDFLDIIPHSVFY
jgi:hypothetical protein